MDDETNVGIVDRLVRFVAGLTILIAAQLYDVSVFIQALMIVVGSVVMVTGVAGYCLLYKMLRISTRKARH